MTIALAWVGTRSDGREDLFFASDSRTRGGLVLDVSPKILTLPRSDCAVCFAGDTAATYPLMMQLANAIGAHGPARDRALDIGSLKGHLLRVFSDIVAGIPKPPQPILCRDVQFLFGGFSWRRKGFRLWTFYWNDNSRQFRARESVNFLDGRLDRVAFIGDWAPKFRGLLCQKLRLPGGKTLLEPLALLADVLTKADPDSTIGGPPQLVRISPHMNTRPLCVLWGRDRRPTLFGRPLYDYENCDYWAIDPFTGESFSPRVFGRRPESEPVVDGGADEGVL